MCIIRKNILLTGLPGVGKTTLIRKVLDNLTTRAAGFITEEIRESGKRKGFRIRTLDGREGVLSHIESSGPKRVGKYGVNVEEFEKIGVASLEMALNEGQGVVIDEIGKMELFSNKFREILLQVLDRSPFVLATIAWKGDTFIENVKKRSDVSIYTITKNNREHLVSEIQQRLNSILDNFK